MKNNNDLKCKFNYLISVIIPIYNVENYLNKCIDSVINQTYQNLEIFLVDDGSNDNCGIICDQYKKIDNRIKVIHKKNGGVSSARNLGLENVHGEYVIFIDSDDYLENNMIEKLFIEINKHNSDVSACNYFIESNESKIIALDICPTIFDNIQYKESLVNSKSICGYLWNKLYRRSILMNDNNYIIFDENVKILEDLLFNLRVAENVKKVSYICDPLYHYIQRENSALNSNNILKMESSLSVYLKIIKELDKYNIEEVNNYKLSYIIEGSLVKIYSNKCHDIDIINNTIRKFLKENVLLKTGKFKIKIKAVVLLFFPNLYKLFKKIKGKGN